MHSQISQCSAIQCNTCFAQTIDQTAVGQTFNTRLSIDTGDPQSAESTLLYATVTVRILARFCHCLNCYRIEALTSLKCYATTKYLLTTIRFAMQSILQTERCLAWVGAWVGA